MRFNYNNEKKQWEKWKKEEESKMIVLGADEKIMRELRKYDWEIFKENRRYKTQEILNHSNLFINVPYYDNKEYRSFDDVLNDIENESLYLILSNTDDITLQIIYLKIVGYKVKEISQLLGISSVAIYHRIQRLRKKLKNFEIRG